jgi:hypothetical protein
MRAAAVERIAERAMTGIAVLAAGLQARVQE